jgi:hypothetical protein
MKDLGPDFSAYSDVRLAILAGSLKNLIYIDEKLIFNRHHQKSWSIETPDFYSYGTAQRALMIECVEICKLTQLINDFDFNLKRLSIMLFGGYIGVMERSGTINLNQLYKHLAFLLRYLMMLDKGRLKHQLGLILSTVKLIGTMSIQLLSKKLH